MTCLRSWTSEPLLGVYTPEGPLPPWWLQAVALTVARMRRLSLLAVPTGISSTAAQYLYLWPHMEPEPPLMRLSCAPHTTAASQLPACRWRRAVLRGHSDPWTVLVTAVGPVKL